VVGEGGGALNIFLIRKMAGFLKEEKEGFFSYRIKDYCTLLPLDYIYCRLQYSRVGSVSTVTR
jgi:hypothetical protein